MSRETGLNSNYADEVRIWAKKEIARLEQEGKARKSLAIRVDELNKKNIEENKELKEENKTLKDANLSSLLSERALLKQIKKLKEENKKPDYPSFLRFAYELGGDALFDAIDTAVPNYTDQYTGWSPSKV
tara:strand:+ start:341 stop:730 length:390 start_codon:yes stop_codon:yes gene_type:complete